MTFYTDGSAHPNPGPGGFGVVVVNKNNDVICTVNEQFTNVTNNMMELKAILYVMKNYGKVSSDCPIVYSDSSYAINTFSNWMFSWANNNWKKSDNKTPENLDIIQEYYSLYQQGYRIALKKIEGHSGNYFNDLADKLATNKIPAISIKEHKIQI